MHHTDYRDNLRKAQHKTTKNRFLGTFFDDAADDKSADLVRAAVAAVLVIVALLQMDPANAQQTRDIGAYGTLQLGELGESVTAPAVNSELKMTIHDDQLNMVIDQSFSNPTTSFQHGEYWFSLPGNAQVTSWQVSLENCSVCSSTNKTKCQPATKLVSTMNASKNVGKAELQATVVNGFLQIPTPAMTPDQRVNIHLNIIIPTNSEQDSAVAMLPLTTHNDNLTISSVSASADFIGSVAIVPAFGVLQPL